MRELVRTNQYVMTLHAAEEMEADGFTVYDVEHCVLSGENVRRQRDRLSGEWKYLIEGRTISGERAMVVGRLGPTGKLIVITVCGL
jgi:hypothetical protein